MKTLSQISDQTKDRVRALHRSDENGPALSYAQIAERMSLSKAVVIRICEATGA